ncbi:hypothetical protein BH23BAC3_BH23BAC3_19410 [soil metagenome]
MTEKKSHTSDFSIGKTGWAAFALLMLGLAVLAGLYFDQNTRINAVEFTGHTFTDDTELQQAFESPVGMLADSVDFHSIMKSVHTLPWVRDLSIRMAFRGVLTVEIDEREPIGMLAGNTSKIFFDEDGVLLDAGLGKHIDVPLVYGFSASAPGDTLKGSEFGQVREFLKAAKFDPFSWATISEVAWNNAEGVVALSSENGVKLLFGRDDFSGKINHWKEFNRSVVSQKGINSFRSIDLRFRNQIVTDEL